MPVNQAFQWGNVLGSGDGPFSAAQTLSENSRRVTDAVMQAQELIEFRDSPIHGLGGFAMRDIHAGTRLVEYLGRKIDKKESLRQCELENPYVFCINDDYDLDGNVDW
ncbi:MAG TPA: hypothetical protein VFB72_13145, partial [Verrucomicrobiae bacterium]|nr:hypothetical protein [Verrucomicrobiae bacterium]